MIQTHLLHLQKERAHARLISTSLPCFSSSFSWHRCG